MRALVFDGKLRVVENFPDPPVGDETLIQVIRAGICATDLQIVRGYLDFKGVPGHEFVGTVVAGPEKLKGRRVVGEINCPCRRCEMCRRNLPNHCRERTVLGIAARHGAFAEYLTLPPENLHLLPDHVRDDQAVFVEPLAAAFQVKTQYPFERDERVAVLGAGRLGLLVAQVLEPAVGHLVLFARGTAKKPVCEKLGFQVTVIDDKVEKGRFDVVVECSGCPEGLASAQALVRPRGAIILKSTYAGPAGANLAATVINEIHIIGSRCGPFPEAIAALASRSVHVEPMISGRFPLRDALRAFERASRPENVKILIEMTP